MRLVELFEELSQIDQDIKDVMMDYFIRLKIDGVTEVPVRTVISEIYERFDIDLDYDVISAFFRETPLIANMNAETIYLTEPSDASDPDDSGETVSDLADKAREQEQNDSGSRVSDLAMKGLK